MKRLVMIYAGLGLAFSAALALSSPLTGEPVSVPAPVSAPATVVLGLAQALAMVEQASPVLKAAQARSLGAQETAKAADSGYYPSIGLAAVDSTGFPGSATGLQGFSGLVASPYREGPSADAFGTWNLVDPTVWHAAAAASYAAEASLQGERVRREQVDTQGLQVYLRAVLYRGDQQAWASLVDSLKGVRDTVEKFVRNGQYSEVQRMLIEDQLDDADLRQQDYGREYHLVLTRLALLTGLRSDGFDCPLPADLDETSLESLLQGGGESPLLLKAEAEAKAAHEAAKGYFAENLPKLELGGSAGWLDDERLVQGKDYSAFAGITLPLFQGFQVQAGTQAAEKEQEAREAERSEAQLELDDFNARMDEELAEARADLTRLLPEQRRAIQAVDLARSRYLNFLGPLSDLQQALKDQVSVETQIAGVKTQLLLALGSKIFVNGGGLGGKR